MKDLGRERKIDVNSMDEESLKVLEQQINTKVTEIINEAEKKLEFLKIYGVGCKLVVGLAKLGKEEEQIEKLIGCKIYKKRKKK
jgi:hypothetical protein